MYSRQSALVESILDWTIMTVSAPYISAFEYTYANERKNVVWHSLKIGLYRKGDALPSLSPPLPLNVV